jgi:hypothetical protein
MLPDDDSVSLPTPPPPRLASREGAIGSALRRFDGIEDRPSVSKPARWAWNRHPQLGLALAASLIVAIGLPAAFIAIRDQGPTSSSVSAPSTSTAQPRRAVVPSLPIPEAAPEPGSPERRTVAPPGASQVRLQREEAKVSPVAETQAAPAVDMAYAAAPPPPAPSAPSAQVAEKAVADGLVVTGSRIPRPNLTTQSGAMNREASSVAAERDETAEDRHAPDWVLNDRSYATFLTQLQNAVLANDREAVIKLVSLPLRVNFNRPRFYRDTRSVRADYDRIFTPKVRKAILAQRFEQLFGRDQGVMIGDGEVWFHHVCSNTTCSPPGPVRIIAINL